MVDEKKIPDLRITVRRRQHDASLIALGKALSPMTEDHSKAVRDIVGRSHIPRAGSCGAFIGRHGAKIRPGGYAATSCAWVKTIAAYLNLFCASRATEFDFVLPPPR
jgi:hypothetical protein